jgi:3-phenylpropionate/trans-cinnamate dioxygenase ferredoxin subunit
MIVELCRLSEIAHQGAKRVMVGALAVAVVRAGDGVYAIEDRCSHADVALSEGEVVDCSIECWLHGSAFDLVTGEPMSPPAVTAVPVYPVTLTDDADPVVLVDLPEGATA